jgi:hypothetical protein
MSGDTASCYFRDDQAKSGLHALLIGVSRYPFVEKVGMEDLFGPSLSVVEMAEWLVANRNALSAPLKSVRVLASPLAEEIEANPALSPCPRAQLQTVRTVAREWQQDAAEAPESATLFYFAGHGIQRSKGDSVLLLEDFLDPDSNIDLERTIGVNNIYNGMGNFRRFPQLAKTQFYLIDACRMDLDTLRLGDFEAQEPTPLFMVERGGVDDRTAPIFFAAAAGKPAWNQKGVSTLFWQDLRACLDGQASETRSLGNGRKEWVVTVGQLNDSLCKMVNRFNTAHGLDMRSFNLDKFSASALSATIRRLDKPPMVPCRVELLPEEAAGHVTLTIDLPGVKAPTAIPANSARVSFELEANIYRIGGTVDPQFKASYRDPVPDFLPIEPPFFNYEMRLAD